MQSLQVGTSANEAASARNHYSSCQRAPLCIYYMLKQAALCKLYFRAYRCRMESHTLTVPLLQGRKPDTVLLHLRAALLSTRGLDSEIDGYSQRVPMVGQGAAAQQLLARGSKGISSFPPTSATCSASPFPIKQNIMFTVMFIIAAHVFWTFLLHRNIVYAGVWTFQGTLSSNESTSEQHSWADTVSSATPSRNQGEPPMHWECRDSAVLSGTMASHSPCSCAPRASPMLALLAHFNWPI